MIDKDVNKFIAGFETYTQQHNRDYDEPAALSNAPTTDDDDENEPLLLQHRTEIKKPVKTVKKPSKSPKTTKSPSKPVKSPKKGGVKKKRTKSPQKPIKQSKRAKPKK